MTPSPAGAPLMVVHVVYALRMGGTERGIVKLVNGLDSQRIQSAIVSCVEPDALKMQVSPSVAVHAFRRRAGQDLRFVVDLTLLLRRLRPTVVHTHAWGTLAEGYVASRLAGVPAIVHGEHGTMDLRPRNVRLQRMLWQRCRRVLAVSNELADRMSSAVGFPRSGIDVLPNGVDTAVFRKCEADRRRVRAELGLTAHAFVFGTVGRLVEVKNHKGLIEAFAAALPRMPGAFCVIVGEGLLRAELERLIAAHGIGHAVRLVGQRSDIDRVLRALDVFVLPSHSEGMANTLLEAMATELPVVCTAVGAAPEIVRDQVTGMLVPAADSSALEAALLEMAGNQTARVAMGVAGRRRVENHYALSTMIERYAALYESLSVAR